MATPSEIPNHPVVQMLDYQGDAFPTGAPYFIKNLCSNFYQTLAFNQNIPGAMTCTAQPEPDCKWLVQYENDDRSRVAFKSARNGLYLAATSSDCKAPMGLSEQMVFWWVRQGSAPGTYWFATTQSKDCFLHTWDCQQSEGSLVASFTNRDPKWGDFHNQPYSMFEQWSAGMSWGLDPTPELLQWKQQQKAVASQGQQSQQDSEQMKKREDAVAERERLVVEREADSLRNSEDFAKREQDFAGKEQAFDKKSSDFDKSYDALKKREEAVRAAEERVKKSKKGGQAEHLATQEEKDKLKDETQDLQTELRATKSQVARLQKELEQARASGGPTTNRSSLTNGSKMQFSIRPPEIKRPSQKLPEMKRPGQDLPEMKRPGQSLPSGFDADMLKRCEAGRKAMATSAEA